MPKRFSKSGRAYRFNETGMALADRGDDLGALDAYLAAIRILPHWDAPWYNKGLVHKYRGEWRESLEANYVPEVVWADRIDPARAIIRSIPLPACGRRWGDLILHDGAPNGYRRLGEREVPVFDELAILERSRRSTFEVLVSGVSEAQVDALVGVASDSDLPAENWTTHTRVLCKACSEGRHFEEGGHDHGPAVNAQQDEFRVAFSTEDPFTLKRFLSDWHKSHRDASLSTPRCVLDALSESEPPPVA